MPNPASDFPNAPPRFFDMADGAKLLQPDNQVAFASDASLETPAGRKALRDALVTAGIMKPA